MVYMLIMGIWNSSNVKNPTIENHKDMTILRITSKFNLTKEQRGSDKPEYLGS